MSKMNSNNTPKSSTNKLATSAPASTDTSTSTSSSSSIPTSIAQAAHPAPPAPGSNHIHTHTHTPPTPGSRSISTNTTTTSTTSTSTNTNTNTITPGTPPAPSTNIPNHNRKVLVVLVSNGVSNLTQASNQRKAKNILHAKKTPYVEVDGMRVEHRDSRNELFAISGIRGNYPQFFFVHSNGATSFIGNYDKIEEINEDTGLPKELLDQHPEIQTWDKVFGDVVDSF